MKRTLLTGWLAVFACAGFAQSDMPVTPMKADKKRPTLGVHFFANDFKTADYWRHNSFKNTFKNGFKAGDMDYGLGLDYLQGITNHIDFAGSLNGLFTNYLFRDRPLGADEKFLLEADAGFNFKLLPDNYILVPYLHAAIGGSMYNGKYFGAYAPLGAGLQVNLGKGDAFLFTNAQYRMRVTDNTNDHFNFSLGFAGSLVPHKEKAPAPPPPPMDTDSDGINDDVDSCKTIPGVAKYNGCPIPDTDHDGINDEQDKCPDVAGLAKYEGCPIPDTDKDGINDEVDKCPNEAGTAKYQGCPIPDTDGDGVNDEADQCPNEAGPSSNNGCPEKAQVMQKQVDTSARQIYFATGKATLLSKSFTALNKVVSLLKDNSDLAIDIEGHTDNTGSDAINLKLSQQRADAVMKYLKSKGISADRMTAKGYGSALPVADNSTADGRAQNRRVEMKLRMINQ